MVVSNQLTTCTTTCTFFEFMIFVDLSHKGTDKGYMSLTQYKKAKDQNDEIKMYHKKCLIKIFG